MQWTPSLSLRIMLRAIDRISFAHWNWLRWSQWTFRHGIKKINGSHFALPPSFFHRTNGSVASHVLASSLEKVETPMTRVWLALTELDSASISKCSSSFSFFTRSQHFLPSIPNDFKDFTWSAFSDVPLIVQKQFEREENLINLW